ncbi:hypothetical protein V1281_007477 [Nitrobacteraceae bacterium AZCC 2161]
MMPTTNAVMAGQAARPRRAVVPAIHVFTVERQDVDTRDIAHEASLRALARA